MYRTEINISARVFQVSWTEFDKQVIKLLGNIQSNVLRIVSVARS